MPELLAAPMAPMAAKLRRSLGGGARTRVILLLAAVLALDTADGAAIGAMAAQLERALRISNAELGLLVTIPSLTAALATIPIGVLTDRVRRVGLLGASVVLWTVAMAASAGAQSFGMLLVTRIALGAVTATAGPTLSSLVGDFFPQRERARIYGYILTGEFVGAGFGFLLSGEVASASTWRAGFVALAIPSLALAYALWRWLPEPARGGATPLEDEAAPARRRRTAGHGERGEAKAQRSPGLAQEQARAQRVAPNPRLVLEHDPTGLSLRAATRYVLSVRTNVILIIASALGYFYFQGVQTFGLVFFARQYHLSHAAATLLLVVLGVGAVAGVQAGGRLADRRLRRGRLNGRILVGGWSYVLAALLFVPALASRSLPFAAAFYLLAACALAARNPPADAARLDIMHSRLWGRAEAVRTFLRRCAVAAAPVSFGLIADAFAATHASTPGQHGYAATVNAQGLEQTFLILLLILAAGGLITFLALRSYPSDVATAAASEMRIRAQDGS